MATEDDTPICPDCVQGKHTNCTGTSWNNSKDEETYCPCAVKNHPETWIEDEVHTVFHDNISYSIYGPGQGQDKKHDEIVDTITSVMYQSVMTREDLEDMLSQRISNLQWNRVQEFLHNKTKKPQIISKEDLFINRPSLVAVIQNEIEKNHIYGLREDKL